MNLFMVNSFFLYLFVRQIRLILSDIDIEIVSENIFPLKE